MVLAILLLGAGLALVIAEVLIPSGGLISLLATACVVGSVVLAFQESGAMGMRFLLATALLVPAALLLAFKIFPRTPFGRRMIVKGLSFESTAASDVRDLALLGREGIVESALRPVGIARIDGRRVDVMSRGEPIEIGAEIRVLEVRGNRILVGRAARESARAAESIEQETDR